MKKCPYCGNPVLDHIAKCPGCGSVLEVPERSGQIAHEDPNKILFEHKGFYYDLAVYPSRISISDKKGNGSIAAHFMPQKSDIFIKSITAVNLKGFSKKMLLSLSDGKIYEMPGIGGGDAEKMRIVLMELMGR